VRGPRRIGRLVITHTDRLLRFGAELVFAICEAKQVEVVILNQGEDTTFEETWPTMCWSSSPSSRPGCTAAARARTGHCWTT
jgi:hypothetical protein